MPLHRTDRRARRRSQPKHFHPQVETLESRHLLAGSGLMAEYFTNISLSGTPAIVRTDANINFNWSTGSPGSGVSSDNFGVHWEGEVKATTAGTYNFRTISDDGVRLWINGNLVINNWTDHSQTTNTSGNITLAAGEKATIVLEYYEKTGSSIMQLQWKTPTSGTTYSAIPQSQLYLVDEEFSGKLAGWLDVKTQFGAVGNGVADDTAALQAALNAVGVNGANSVLYLPAGTYRITSTLTMVGKQGVSILGEDPTKVTIKWTGAAGGTMLDANGCAAMRYGRITWDGSATAPGNGAGLGIFSHTSTHVPGTSFSSHHEHADEVFKNMAIGIQSGMYTDAGNSQDDDVMVKRGQFINCTTAGVLTDSGNALHYWIWDSLFQNCYAGVQNMKGQMNVYRSTFKNSTYADFYQNDTASYVSVRDCYSTGSRRFYEASNSGSACPVTIQGNTVLDTSTEPFAFGHMGPITMIDNVIRRSASQTGLNAVAVFTWTIDLNLSDLVAVGNTYNAATFVGFGTGTNMRLISNNQVSTITAPAEPDRPTFAPVMRRSIWEVASTADTTAIQAGITNAAVNSSSGRTVTAGYLANVKPIVHFAKQDYNVTSTITVPAQTDMQIIGDGVAWVNGTRFVWAGLSGGTVMRVAGPSHVSMSNIGFVGGLGQANGGLVFDNADQVGGRIFADQLFGLGANYPTGGTFGVGTFVEGLDQTVIEARALYHGANNDTGIKVVGGPLANAGTPGAAKVNIFGNQYGHERYSVGVSKGAKVLITDTWVEGDIDKPEQFAVLTGKGTFTAQGGLISLDHPNTGAPPIDVNGFTGNATILSMALSGGATVRGSNAATKSLFMGNRIVTDNAPYTNTATAGQHGQLENINRYTTNPWGDIQIPQSGDTSDTFILAMLAHTRGEHAGYWTPKSFSTTDIRLNRVGIGDVTGNGIRITRYIAPDATATATSSDAFREPQNIFNGKEFAGGVQGVNPNGSMYLSAWNQLTPTITIDLKSTYNITGFKQWNYNEINDGWFNNTVRGVKTVNILTSPTGLAGSYTSRGTFTFAQATGVGDEGEDQNAKTNGVVGTWTGIRFIQLQVLTNWGDPNVVGLSKIQFRTV
jgi:hypothetical protein